MMFFQEFPADIDWWATLEALLTIFVVPLILGGIGAYIGFRLALRRFKDERLFAIGIEGKLERTEALRRVLAILPTVKRALVRGTWKESSVQTDEDVVRHIDEMRQLVNESRTLFTFDEEPRMGMNALAALIGVDATFYQPPHSALRLPEILERAEERLKSALLRYETELGLHVTD